MLAWSLVLFATVAVAQPRSTVDRIFLRPDMDEQMQDLMARAKFDADPEHDYPGMPNRGIARRLDRAMNASLQIMMDVAREQQSRQAVLERVRSFLGTTRSLGLAEAENERILWCYRRACEILDIVVEDGLFESWLRGSPAPR
jgi:hypothetical protein